MRWRVSVKVIGEFAWRGNISFPFSSKIPSILPLFRPILLLPFARNYTQPYLLARLFFLVKSFNSPTLAHPRKQEYEKRRNGSEWEKIKWKKRKRRIRLFHLRTSLFLTESNITAQLLRTSGAERTRRAFYRCCDTEKEKEMCSAESSAHYPTRE